MAIGVINAYCVVRLDVALMNHRSLELTFDHIISAFKAFVYIATLELQMSCDVGLLVGAVILIAQSREQDWRTRLHRILHRHDRWKDLVIYLDQPECLLRNVWAGGGYRRHRVSIVK